MSGSGRGLIYKISLTVAADTEDAAAALLTDIFAQPATIETDVEKQTTRASVYLETEPASFPQWRNRLRAGVMRLETCGFQAGPLVVQRLRREDWAESWKRHFKPIQVGRRLRVVPSWSRSKAGRRCAVVVLDPGLSFGTGHHPTTRFCLEQIVAFRRVNQPQAFLDLGTGSGILAIAAAKLGYKRVEALDIDPQAIRIAKDNAERNGARVAFGQKDLTRLSLRSSRKFDLICANLISDLLISERRRILNRLAPGGRLVVAGILKNQFPEVAAAFEREGLRLFRAKTLNEWRSGAFHRPSR